MSVYSSRPSAKKTGSRLLIYYLLNASIFEALPVFIFLLFSFKSFGLQQLLQLLPHCRYRQSDHIVVVTLDAIHISCEPSLNAIGTRFVHRLSGSNVAVNLLVSHLIDIYLCLL